MARILMVPLLAILSACSGGGLSAAEASRLAEPHLRHFEHFERWSGQVAVADPAFRTRATLEETLFAPLRREETVWGAWMERGRLPAIKWGHLTHPPKSLVWTRIRVEPLGEVEVTSTKLPDPRDARKNRAAIAPCILLRRPIRGMPVPALTVAYRR